MADPLEHTEILRRYRARTPRSADQARVAADLFPGGVTHDSRHLPPYGIFVDRAERARKWDIDGNAYIDFFGGHGALLLGHGRAEVVSAVREAMERGTQFAASHPLENDWAERIKRLVPSAERVRFTSSGTEASLMAVRLARAHTGRDRILRFPGHYHGWQDDMTKGYAGGAASDTPLGVPSAVAGNTVLADPWDDAALEAVFDREGPFAAAILEPLGSATGQVPIEPAFLHRLRALTAESATVLIFDEVITGFRVAPGGVQAELGVTPDLTVLAKIVAGGLPGGAIVGRRTILEQLDFAAAARARRDKIYHPGTFNANPLSAAAGVAVLDLIADGGACRRAAKTAQELRSGLNAVLAEEGVGFAAYGRSSAFHLFLNPEGRAIRPWDFDPFKMSQAELRTKPALLSRALRLAMLVHGVDLAGWPGGLVSTAHGGVEIDETLDAFRASLRLLYADGLLAR